MKVTGAHGKFWLVLGQSINNGWRATVNGTGKNLGTPVLIDGFANGWLVSRRRSGTMTDLAALDPADGRERRLVGVGLGDGVCIVLVFVPARRRLRRRRAAVVGAEGASASADTAMSLDSATGWAARE